MRFDSVITRKNTKRFQIQTSDYLQSGLHPVVDQGQKYIVGYSNRSDRVFRCPPEVVIVFGDHTCVVKFVDFDFVVGADGTQVLQTFKDFCTRFIAYQLEYNGVAQKVGITDISKFKEKFIIPDISEQEAIVNVLSDFDSQMQALENLISKKRDIKQGTMQQLLTAKTRLNGFSLEWKSVLLGDLADIVRGKLITKNQTVPGEVPVIAGGIEPAYFHNVSNQRGKQSRLAGQVQTQDTSHFTGTPFSHRIVQQSMRVPTIRLNSFSSCYNICRIKSMLSRLVERSRTFILPTWSQSRFVFRLKL